MRLGVGRLVAGRLVAGWRRKFGGAIEARRPALPAHRPPRQSVPTCSRPWHPPPRRLGARLPRRAAAELALAQEEAHTTNWVTFTQPERVLEIVLRGTMDPPRGGGPEWTQGFDAGFDGADWSAAAATAATTTTGAVGGQAVSDPEEWVASFPE